MKQLALSFQMLIREDYQLFILATGLFENISALDSENFNSTQRFNLSPLNLVAIASSYKATLSIENNEAIKCAKLTKGYAFAFQLLGYLMFEGNKKTIDDDLLDKYDQYLNEFTNSKIWSSLTMVEQKILSSIKSNNPVPVSSILKDLNMPKEYYSRYRERLIKKGLIDGSQRGSVVLTLPRFYEFIQNKLLFW